MKSDVENDAMPSLEIEDYVNVLLSVLEKSSVRVWLLQQIGNGGACFSDNLREKDVCKVLAKNRDQNEIIRFSVEESYSMIEPENRLHINSNCPKRTGRYAQPDAISVNGNSVKMICEIKVHRFGNDCELFNGVVQLKEYMTLYGHEDTIGVLLILGHLVEAPNQTAWNFLGRLADGNVIIVYANLRDQHKLEITTFQNGGTRQSEIEYEAES